MALLGSGYYSYLQRSDITVYPDGSPPLAYRPPNELVDIEQKMRIGVVPHVTALKPDQIQYCLLRAITVLNDAANGLSDEARQAINSERAKYTTVLLRYLQSKHGTELGTRRFGETMQFLTNVYSAQQADRQYYVYRKFVLQTVDVSTFWNQCLRDSDA
ncbi:Nuclear hormone receptor [Aphelenchoides avenae]|nr:Nuclear hormone receptor [Aphelenchus avenae]